jgi:hypothetical protein
LRHVERADGGQAIADDLPPVARAVAMLLEHANQRRDDGLPLPCLCGECQRHRGAARCTSSADGRTLIVERTCASTPASDNPTVAAR